MIEPAAPLDDLELMADWLELWMFESAPEVLDKVAIGEFLEDAGLIAFQDGGTGHEDEDLIDQDHFLAADDEGSAYAELLLDKAAERARALGSGYPFVVEDGEIRHKSENPIADWPCYLYLLLVDNADLYDNAIGYVVDTDSAKLFEQIVASSSKGLFGGRAQRFGWPRETGWPTGIKDRLARLAQELDLELESNLDQKTHPNDSDKGLDVAASLTVAGSDIATPWVLLQCAGGANWRGKSGEPPLDDWRDLMVWNGQLLKGLAVPFRLPRDSWTLERTARKFAALVLDRDRVAAGHPDKSLDADLASQVADWCKTAIGKLSK